MTMFAIISQAGENSALLESAVARIYKDNFLQIGTGNWLVADSATAREVSDKLGVTDGKNGSAIVVEFVSYYGRANNNIWAWIKNKWESKSA